MVESDTIKIKEIIDRFPAKEKEDITFLIEFCRAYPNLDLGFLLIRNYPTDFFNADIWHTGDDIFINYKDKSVDKDLFEEIFEQASTVSETVNYDRIKIQNELISKFLDLPDKQFLQ